MSSSRDAGKGGGRRGASPPLPFLKGGRAKVPFYKVYFINVYMWTEPYHLSIVNHLLSTICSEIVTTAYRFLISALLEFLGLLICGFTSTTL